MQIGNETWKWAAVFVLLAVFVVVANQAYQHINSQEDFAPPDDYLKGDSWDLEHGNENGPGSAQAMQLSPNFQDNPDEQTTVRKETPKPAPVVIEDNIDWGNIDAPQKD